MSEVLRVEKSEGIATLTLNRPEARNALNRALRDAIRAAFAALEKDDSVGVAVLTGAGPAFCAGLDLKELSQPGTDRGSDRPQETAHDIVRAIEGFDRPVIGAINGVAVTGGFELALNCDFLVASERAKFGDTHARVGVMPGWGLTVLLPQAIGVRRAREMSYTGNFLSAEEAFHLGLVNHVVAHDELLPLTRRIATDIIGNDQEGVRQIRSTYDAIHHDDDGWEREARDSRAWQQARFSPEKVAARRTAIQDRGRTQRG